jgi:predicted RNA-binding protein YlqC (UPF0109 family)
MADKFIRSFAKLIADFPDDIRVDREDVDDSFSQINVWANQADTGKLIGKNGKMISSLKTVVSGCKAKDGRSYRVTISSNE